MKGGGRRRKTLSSDLQNGGKNTELHRPKLAEGFFEIETLRKKRVRKGVKQYLIKWRGWPESANTWEPVESLTSCLDLIEEFESSYSGKRRRKRKHSVGPLLQSKEKQQDSSVGIKDLDVNNSKLTENNTEITIRNKTTNHSKGLDEKTGEVKTTSHVNQENTTDLAIHIKEDPAEPENWAVMVDETEVLRSSPRIGARRRKPRAVKRFKKTTDANDVIVEDDVNNVDDVFNGLDSENIHDAPPKVSVITKILRPVNFSISVLNDMEDVCVSFLVLRSDGEEIVVDNKYLKENNPVLLINYYEQHLRYNCSSE